MLATLGAIAAFAAFDRAAYAQAGTAPAPSTAGSTAGAPAPPAPGAPSEATEPTAPLAPPPGATDPTPSEPPPDNGEALIPVGQGEEAVDTSKRPVNEAAEARADRPVRSPLMNRLMRPRLTYDINLEGGVGYLFSSPTRWNGIARGGLGVTWVKDPFWNTLRFTYEYSGLADATWGAQIEMAWFERGLWAQAGGLYDFKGPGHGGVMGAIGFAIFGVEGEYRGAEPTGKAWGVYLKARLPVSALIQALTE